MRSRWAFWAAVAAGCALLLLLWPVIRPAFHGGVQAAAAILASTGQAGPLVVVGLQILQAVISPLPSWPVTMAAGALYGPVWGTIYSLAGGTAGAAVNFLLARRFGQPWVQRKFGDRWIAFAAKLGPVHFLLLSLLGRLIPVASFDVVAYVAGISQLSLGAFLGVAVLGQAPALLAYALFGSDLAAAQSAGLWGSALLVLFTVLIVGGRRLWQRFAP